MYAELRSVANDLALPGKGGSVAALIRKAIIAFLDPERSSPDVVALGAAARLLEVLAVDLQAKATQLQHIIAYLAGRPTYHAPDVNLPPPLAPTADDIPVERFDSDSDILWNLFHEKTR